MHFHLMAKPSGASCNLRCTYCFYTEKENLYGGLARLRMPVEILESYIRQYIVSQDTQEIQFAWQGGEPTLLGLDFFERAVSLQARYANGRKITNTLQTNATLLTEGWCRFLKKHNFLVGVSIDGPRRLHDHYRIKVGRRPTFDTVMAGLARLKKHKVAFNTLTVINDHNAQRPLEVYRFLKKNGDGHMQFIPAVERLPDTAAESLGLSLAMPPSPGDQACGAEAAPWSVSPRRLADFYIRIFDTWVRHDVGRVFVQFFDVALGNWMGADAGLCHFAPTCGRAAVLEHNGDIYACDHYVYPQYKLGNIMETPLAELMVSAPQRQFGAAKRDHLSQYCLGCEVRALCHGDCPKHRFSTSANGERGLSYLCEAYKAIFNHMAPYLEMMAERIQAGRPAADIMRMLSPSGTQRRAPVPGRNAPCLCGSGRKYKRCCGA